MASLASSFVSARDLHLPPLLSGRPLKMSEHSLLNFSPMKLSPGLICQRKVKIAKRKSQVVQAGFRDAGRPSSTDIFVGGFLLGGIIVGALGCIYAPQISKALAGADRKDLMRKLPKFIYDEENALEKKGKKLSDKIAQLNSAIDDVSSQLQAENAPNGADVPPDEVEVVM